MNTFQPEVIMKQLKDLKKANSFTARKLTDTPTDDLSAVNRKYVTWNGTTAARPPVPVLGQFYFDTTLNKPIWFGNSSTWIDATGAPV